MERCATEGGTSLSVQSKPIRLRAWLFGLALVIGSTGCRQLVGFHDGPGPEDHDAGSGTEAGTYRSKVGRWIFVDPACGACIDDSCKVTATDCTNDPSCHAYEACVALCGDKPCVSECLSHVPSAILSPEVRPLLHCVADSCRAACPSSVVTLPNGDTCGPVFNKLACASCCCPEVRQCDDDPDCVRQSACARQCAGSRPGQSCFEACTGRDPDPITPKVNIASCAEGLCRSSCGGEDWRCLGKVWQSQPSPGLRKLYGSVLRIVDSGALAGFRVKMCSALGAISALDSQGGADLCPMPLDEQVSNEAGNVVLDLNKSSGLGSYFEVIPPPGQDYPTTHFFLAGWTLTHSRHSDFFLAARNSTFSLPASSPGHGSVGFQTYDCRQVLNRVPGVVVSASPAGSASTVYLAPGFVPDLSATSTSSEGLGSMTNLPEGQVTLSANRQETGELIGKTPIVIQSDTETFVELVPTP
jgi:hypothetical protein